MKIISNFKDYYDSARCGPGDPKRIYYRVTKEIPPEKFRYPLLEEVPIPRDWEGGCLLFCGRVYPFWQWWNDTPLFFSEKKLIESLSIRELEEFAYFKNFQNFSPHHKKRFEQDVLSFKRKCNERLIEEPHIEFDAPVIIFQVESDKKVIINPKLYKIEKFASLIDPYTAYQEIESFVSNNLVKQKDPNITVPDEIKAQSHGFNKWSFRTPPRKREPQR